MAEWQAEVKEIIEKDEKFLIILSETAFYPGGGGQPADSGNIDGIAVEEVYEKDGEIYHVLNRKPQNRIVKCAIDIVRRRDLTQQHTGQHILSSVFDLYGGETSSFHLGDDEVSIDISLSDISGELLKTIEDKANGYIYRDLIVKAHFVSPEGASDFPLRKAPPRDDVIRIVEIDNIDFSPCCGTHVTRTGEVGIIKVLKAEKMRNQTRIYFKCGMRALRDYQDKHAIVSALSRLYRTSEGEIPARSESMMAQLKSLQKELSDLKEKTLALEAKGIAGLARSKVIRMDLEDKKADEISLLAKYILQNGDFILVLSSIPDKRLLFAHSGAFVINCGKVFKDHLAEFKGKGGGSDKWANAGFNDVNDMKNFAEFLNGLASSLSIHDDKKDIAS
ncbi:alanyl-tRNA editing protein [Methanooceanicella nereidis]|nr:alanyl-tRNA editing protein [Methanocella sp. CWC-04]